MLTAQPSQGCTRDEVTSIRRPDSVKRGGHHANIHSDEYPDARGTPDPAQRSRPPRAGEQGDNRQLVEVVVYPGEEHIIARDLLEKRAHVDIAVNEGLYL